jgi:hypothetical protein
VQSSTNGRTTTFEQKKNLGLCYKCDEKYFSGHKCKIQEENGEEIEPEDDKEIQVKEVPPEVKEAVVSNCLCSTLRKVKMQEL